MSEPRDTSRNGTGNRSTVPRVLPSEDEPGHEPAIVFLSFLNRGLSDDYLTWLGRSTREVSSLGPIPAGSNLFISVSRVHKS